MVLKVKTSLKGFITFGATKVSNILVEGVDVGLKSTWFRKTLIAKFTSDLVTDPVCSQVISERIPVRVLFVADITLWLLVTVCLVMNQVRGFICKLFGAKITRKLEKFVIHVTFTLNIREVGVAGNMKTKMAAQILNVRELF